MPADTTTDAAAFSNMAYDVLIVGGGTAGLALAARSGSFSVEAPLLTYSVHKIGGFICFAKSLDSAYGTPIRNQCTGSTCLTSRVPRFTARRTGAIPLQALCHPHGNRLCYCGKGRRHHQGATLRKLTTLFCAIRRRVFSVDIE